MQAESSLTKTMSFQVDLHGVGISVVNALSLILEVRIKRDGNEYEMVFENGHKETELEIIGTVGKKNTGTSLHFWPNGQYFDTVKFSVKSLKHNLRAKAVLCPGLHISFTEEAKNETEEWYYEDGIRDYLVDSIQGYENLPTEPFLGEFKSKGEAVDWALCWLPEGGELIQESYVNLIPTSQGGTHTNGLTHRTHRSFA